MIAKALEFLLEERRTRKSLLLVTGWSAKDLVSYIRLALVGRT